jgi:cytoskeletal protein RodZ
MDILAGMLAYVAGIGALFAALAVSFFVFFAPLQTETQPQNARAMLVRPSTPNKPAAEARAKRNATQSAGPSEKGAERHAAAAGSSLAAQATASARDPPAQTRRIHGSSAAAHPRRARAARPTSRTQALRAGSSVTPIEFRRNLQA